ncbi:hypothetical protein [Tsuneonella sp. HG222]
MTEATIVRYEVTNRISGKTTSFKTGTAATNACDRMDRAYGAVVCTRRAIWSDQI